MNPELEFKASPRLGHYDGRSDVGFCRQQFVAVVRDAAATGFRADFV